LIGFVADSDPMSSSADWK